ncbi:phosphodiester glycosidase family protein [Streptomyces sp. CC208A]|uniref:phosphodiester glycosidase family protein n=1 Tax=Streptomyces sp. CC208A TaxID=3044573 RepID=UPI0024A7E1DB|nr:phosphodiester glycosidase family protein [Streptomyces sp. CC208A]
MPVTRTHRPLVGLVAVVGALAFTTSAVAAPTAEEPLSPLAQRWTQGTPVTLATGVTHTTWTETTPDNRAAGRILQIVEIDPTAGAVTLESFVGTGDASAEPVTDQLAAVSSVASRHPYAGVNGGLFQREPSGSTAAKPVVHTGASAIDGVLHSSSCWDGGKGSTGAVIQYGIPYITKLLTKMELTAPTGETIRIDDVNRTPGRAPHCARDAEDVKVSSSPVVYTDPDEIVVFTDDYGIAVPKPGTDPAVPATADKGFEVVLDANGVVTDAHEGRGGITVPAGGRVLQGVGTGAAWLRARFVRDDRATIDMKLHDVTMNRDIPLDASVDVVSSFHQLLRNGEIPVGLSNSCSGTETGADGTTPICTDSRTALGTNVKGHPVLVTLTGKANEDGDYLRSFAELLDSTELALVDALNLDGGGSTTLVTGTQVRTPPTDTENGVKVHRKVADTVYTGVGGYGMYAK